MFEVVDDTARTSSRVLGSMMANRKIGAMLHTTDGRNSLKWLQGASAAAGRPASADYLVDRDGTIHLLVPFGQHAYHAGKCWWQGKVDQSDYVSRLLHGIEIENADSAGEQPTPAQHLAVAGLLKVLAHKYGYSPLWVFGHYGLAYPMGRRSDPYQWNWGLMFWYMAFEVGRIQLYGATDAMGGYYGR